MGMGKLDKKKMTIVAVGISNSRAQQLFFEDFP